MTNTVHEVAIRTAANRWYDSNDESADVSTGIAALGDIVKAVAPTMGSLPPALESKAEAILEAVAALLQVHARFQGDTDGEASQTLVVALTEAGFPEPEDFEPLTDAERGEVWESWQEVFRDDPSDAVEVMTGEWTDRDWRNEFDDMFRTYDE